MAKKKISGRTALSIGLGGVALYGVYRIMQSRRGAIAYRPDEVPETTLVDPSAPPRLGRVYVSPTETFASPHTPSATGPSWRAIVRAQAALQMLRYNVGPTGADGRLGHNTTAALRQFQTDRGLPVTGRLDASTLPLLEAVYFAPDIG